MKMLMKKQSGALFWIFLIRDLRTKNIKEQEEEKRKKRGRRKRSRGRREEEDKEKDRW